MRICHISDTHGARQHTKLDIPECDVLIHSGDIGGRTNLYELTEFLVWMEQQPAKKKIFCAGNHDLILDKDWMNKKVQEYDSVAAMILKQQHSDAKRILEAYDVVYLDNKDYVFEGVKFYGSPISPSFHRDYWAFNADRGSEIKNYWGRIPSDVNVLITHTPVYGILDDVQEYKRENENDAHVGCKDLLEVIKKRLFSLKLHCCGHIHDQYGVRLERVSNTRRVMFSNGAVMTNKYDLVVKQPLIINI